MPTNILMPALSPTMEKGNLARWLKKEGDKIKSGDVIAEIETDKATMEYEAVDEGTLAKIVVPEGTQDVAVNAVIAVLADEGEDVAAAASSAKGAPQAAAKPAASSFETPAARAPQDEAKKAAPPTPTPSPRPEEGAKAPVSKDAGPRASTSNRIFSSPLARRLAKESHIDLTRVQGSGPHGRVIARDIEAAKLGKGMRAATGAPAAAAIPTAASPSDAQIRALYQDGSYDFVPHDSMRKIIAQRLTLSKQTIPHFYLAIDCQLDALMAARPRLNALAPQEGPRAFKLSLNDFIVKALAMALQTVPAANATWTEQGILRHRASDIAVAVALEGGGLHTPVIRDAEIKSLSEISNEMRDLAARARSKRLAPHEYQGGSTTISNLGMFGIDRFDAVINPPQASIMAVGRAEKRPVVKDDALKIATVMSVTLSVDHRVIDGALGAELLAAFKAYIEDPVTMLV
jgi:pyruvate dehydrogenase E2 component (dihydrolipoamide acetyltransferase)